MPLNITGRLPSGKHKERIQQSPNYNSGSFQDDSPTSMKPEGVSYWKRTEELIKKHPETALPGKLPFVKSDLA